MNRDAPVVGALVLATHTPSGTEYSAIVDGTGNFRIMNMRSGGPYSVKISMLGFQTVLNEGINIALGDNLLISTSRAHLNRPTWTKWWSPAHAVRSSIPTVPA